MLRYITAPDVDGQIEGDFPEIGTLLVTHRRLNNQQVCLSRRCKQVSVYYVCYYPAEDQMNWTVEEKKRKREKKTCVHQR